MPEGSVPTCSSFCARVRPGTPKHAPLRQYTKQLVAGVMDPDLNLRELSP